MSDLFNTPSSINDKYVAATDSTREAWDRDSAIVIAGAQTFYQVGMALIRIRDSKSHKHGRYDTFEACCHDLFHLSRSRAYQLMDAVAIMDNLDATAPTRVDSGEAAPTGTSATPAAPTPVDSARTAPVPTNATPAAPTGVGATPAVPLPTSEAQVRPLANVPPAKRPAVWNKAVAAADGAVPTPAQVREAAAEVTGVRPKTDDQKRNKLIKGLVNLPEAEIVPVIKEVLLDLPPLVAKQIVREVAPVLFPKIPKQ